ncbi:MAG: CocE/NonD family hydrolase [Steroidobacteraceae bacterium]
MIRTSGSGMLAALLQMRKTRSLAGRAMNVIPLRDADRVLNPQGIAWWQDWVNHAEPNDPFWDAIDYGRAADSLPPTVMSTGWYDIFLPWQLRDFAAARAAARDPAHPTPACYARHTGSAESLGDARTLIQAHQQILHGPRHPSVIRVPLG